MAEHVCVDCKVVDPDETKPVRKIATENGAPRCETHRRQHLIQQRKNARARQVERTYGLSPEDNHALYLFQGGRCWLCGKATGATKSLAVDHDHKTNEVRGRLCGPCNQFIGKLGDDPDAARRLVGYLTGDTPYRRLKAQQTLDAAGEMGVWERPEGSPRDIWKIQDLGDELFATWSWRGSGGWNQTLVRRADGVWSVTRD